MTALPAIITDGAETMVHESLPVVRQADDDAALLAMWCARSRSANTRRNYARQGRRFLTFLADRGLTLATARLGDLQAYLAGLGITAAPATRANATAALKSLFSFAQETGYLGFNPSRVVKAPAGEEHPGRAHSRRTRHAAHGRPRA